MDARLFKDLLMVRWVRDRLEPFISSIHFPCELYSWCLLSMEGSSIGQYQINLCQLVVFDDTRIYTFPCVKYLGNMALSHITAGTLVFPAFEYISQTSLDGVPTNFHELRYVKLRELSFPNVTRVYTIPDEHLSYGRGYLCQRRPTSASVEKLSLESVVVIESGCFEHSAIRYLYAPKCRMVGKGAFDGCHNLVEVDLPCCEEVGAWAFAGILSLRSVKLPALMSVHGTAFDGSTYEGCVVAGGRQDES